MNAPNGTDPQADSATDTLNFTSDAPIVITGDSATDTLNWGFTLTSPGADADSATTSSPSFLEIVSGGLTLLRGCANGEGPGWNETTDVWEGTAFSIGGAGLWEDGTFGVFEDDKAVIVGVDAAWSVLDGTVGDLKVTDDLEIDGNHLAFYLTGALGAATNVANIRGSTSDASDTGQISIYPGNSAGPTRGAYLTLNGNEGGTAGTQGDVWLASGDVASSRVTVRSEGATGSEIYIEAEDGATDNLFTVTASGFDFSGNSGDNVTLQSGIKAYVNDWIGIGGTNAGASACIDNDGADRLYHDTDCDGTKDAGEEYIDQAGGAGGGTSVIRFDATALHATETNFAPIDEEAGTNVEYLMTLYGPTTDVCRNGKFPVPPDADLTQSVTMRLWFTGDGTADASGTDVIWYVKMSDVDAGETYDTAYATETFTAVTLTTSNDTTMFEATKTFTGTSQMAAGDFIFFGVCRDADNASDNYDGSARLAYMTWEFPE